MPLDLNFKLADHRHRETVLLLHGFMSDYRSMLEIGETLSRKFNILYVDLPGFGRSASKEYEYDMDVVAESLKELLNDLKLDKVHVFGYSMGGRTALAFSILYPRSVLSLVLESASPGPASPEEQQDRIRVDEERAARIVEDYESFLDEWESMGLFQSQQNLDAEAFELQRRMREEQHPLEVADSLRKYGTGAQPSYWNRLTELEMPVLLITGGLDHKFVTINERMQKIIPRSSLKVIDGTGHNIHLESKEKFDTMISEFLI